MTTSSPEKVVWITGAGKGIGRALARKMADNGWTVAASARTATDLESLAAESPEGRVYVYRLNVTDEAATIDILNAMEKEIGLPNLAVLNAGTHIEVSGKALDAEPFRHLMETNFMSVVHGMSVLVPRMQDRGQGHVAVVSSLAGYRGLPSSAAYGASKAALINMCEALRPELAETGIKLQLVNPGFVETPLTDRNEFSMPFLIPAEQAATAIMNGLEKDAFEISFPWRFALIMKLLRLLPDRLFFAVTRRMIKE